MKNYIPIQKVLILFLIIGGLFFAVSCKKAENKPAADAKTHTNLLAAYEGESNANVKYLLFAKIADDEGYGQVASLFRAAALAEEIHAKNHAEVIKKMGGTPKAKVVPPEVKTTKENLEAALKGETYEKDVMYPTFISEAKAENMNDAVKTYNFALQAETEHAKLYQEALNNLENWKDGKKEFTVCPVCGYTTIKGNLEKCPVCFTKKDMFKTVN